MERNFILHSTELFFLVQLGISSASLPSVSAIQRALEMRFAKTINTLQAARLSP